MNSTESSARVRFSRSPGGFSFIEVLVLIAVLTTIAAIVTPNLVQTLVGARVDRALVSLQEIVSAIEAFEDEVGEYPGTVGQLAGVITTADRDICDDQYRTSEVKRWDGPYLPQIVPPTGVPIGIGTVHATLTYEEVGGGGGGPEGGSSCEMPHWWPRGLQWKPEFCDMFGPTPGGADQEDSEEKGKAKGKSKGKGKGKGKDDQESGKGKDRDDRGKGGADGGEDAEEEREAYLKIAVEGVSELDAMSLDADVDTTAGRTTGTIQWTVPDAEGNVTVYHYLRIDEC